MLKIILSGCNGRMGQVVTGLAAEEADLEIVCGVDLSGQARGGYPVCTSPAGYFGEADVLLDFSSPAALDGLLNYCRARRLPLVLCATGYSAEQVDKIKAAAEEFPVFRSGNMSLGLTCDIDVDMFCADLERYAAGKPLHNLVDRIRGY